jgi:hypothetical protein
MAIAGSSVLLSMKYGKASHWSVMSMLRRRTDRRAGFPSHRVRMFAELP